MLSLPAVRDLTNATPVLIYRHPGAVLASYRRMGWSPDIAEVEPILPGVECDLVPESRPPAGAAGEQTRQARDIAWFWNALHAVALADLENPPGAVIVSHEELATGGPAALHHLFDVLGLPWPAAPPSPAGRDRSSDAAKHQLHDLARDSVSVATSWREQLTDVELEMVDGCTQLVQQRLEIRRLRLPCATEANG